MDPVKAALRGGQVRRTKKVLSSARFRTAEPSAFINADAQLRCVAVGVRGAFNEAAMGFVAKVAEQCGGRSLLDYSVWLDLAYPHVIGVFGTRGTGKSFDLGVLIESLIGLPGVAVGAAPSSAAVVFDVQNQFWTLGLPPSPDLPEDAEHLQLLNSWGLDPCAAPNVVLWVPAGCSTPLEQTQDLRLSPSQLESSDWLQMLELDRYSPIGQALLALLAGGGSCDPEALARRAVPGNQLSAFQQGTIDALRWRLSALAGTGLVGNPGVDIDELLVEGRVSVLLLRELPDSLRALAVGVLMRIFAARMGAYHQERRVARRQGGKVNGAALPERLWVLLDEAHTVAPREGRTAATDAVVDYVKRGRDAGLSMVFATQQPAAVDNKLMSQVDLTFTHALGFESDLQAAIARMPTRTAVGYDRSGFQLPSLPNAIRSLGRGEAIVADSANGRIFIAQVRPRLSAHGGNTPPVAGADA